MDGEAGNPFIHAAVSAFAPMRITCVGSQRSDTFYRRCKTAENLSHVVGNLCINIASIR